MKHEFDVERRTLPGTISRILRTEIRRFDKLFLRKRSKSLQVANHWSKADGLSRVTLVVINLERRPDRLESFATQMKKLGITKWIRVSAVDGKKQFPNLPSFYAGSLGCTLSHISALETDLSDSEAIFVCEDDLEFLESTEVLSRMISQFLDSESLDVLAISGRPRGASLNLNRELRVVTGLVGRGGYIVKPHMIPVLTEAFSSGIPLLKQGKRRGKGDLRWRKVQRSHVFAHPRWPVACQAAGYSDIEGRDLGPR